MRHLTLLLVFHQALAQFFDVDKCAIDYRSLENMWEYKLIHDLEECGYDIYKPPPQNGSEPIKVIVRFLMKTFKLNSELQEFSAFLWIFIKWQDVRLKWDPKKYDGLEDGVIANYKIWVPGFEQTNNIGDYFENRYMYMPCDVDSSGEIRCSARVGSQAKCSTDLRDWPFDQQYCKLEYGIRAETGVEIKLDVREKAVILATGDYGAEWDIRGYEQESSNKHVSITYRLERHAGVLTAIVIYPFFILFSLTLSSLLVDARRNTRLLVTCFSLMCHFYFLSELAGDIPRHSKDPPTLLMLYRGSFIMTSISIVLSFFLNLMCKKETACPNWIVFSNDYVNMKFIRYLIWPRWETKGKEDAAKTKLAQDWTDFANLVNAAWILVSLIVYVSMYSALMPHPLPKNTNPKYNSNIIVL